MTAEGNGFEYVLAAFRQADQALVRGIDPERIDEIGNAEAHPASAHRAASNHPGRTPQERSAQVSMRDSTSLCIGEEQIAP
ncbi:MAG: hypothetical protein RIA09_20160 [Hoeflea sp.]|uniref:hypothetical protein n=1 Tax=Hoeflea sp. TaxID=1940281 RepID=UPI0032EE3C60